MLAKVSRDAVICVVTVFRKRRWVLQVSPKLDPRPRTQPLRPIGPTSRHLSFAGRLIRTRTEKRAGNAPQFLPDTQPAPPPEYNVMYPLQGQTEAHEVGPPLEASPDSASSQRKRTSASSPAESNADGRKVHRVSRACDYCKSKKTKCSGTRPCDSCTKRRIACEYATEYLRGRPPTPPAARESASSPRSRGAGVDGTRDTQSR